MRKMTLIGLMASAALIGLSAQSHAALVDCGSDALVSDGTAKVHDGTSDKNTAVSKCQFDDSLDNSLPANETNINSLEFFGFNDWEGNPGQVQIEFDDGVQSGDWTIDTVDFTTFDYMIAFKDGADTGLIGFLFNEEFSSGGWDSPFMDPPFTGLNDTRDVSHLSIFRRQTSFPPGDGQDIPVPASLALLGTGLIGLGALARRRRN